MKLQHFLWVTLIVSCSCSMPNSKLNLRVGFSLLKNLAKHHEILSSQPAESAEISSGAAVCSLKRKISQTEFDLLDESNDKSVAQNIEDSHTHSSSSYSSSNSDSNSNISEISNFDPFLRIPNDAIYLITSFMDLNSIESLEESSDHFYQIYKKFINDELFRFNPIFVFEEHEMNRIMFSFVNSNFLFYGIENSSNPDFIDAIGMTCFRNIHRDKSNRNFDLVLSRTVVILILNFLFEIFFGQSELVPTSHLDFKYFIIKKIIQYDMPKCVENYRFIVKQRIIKLKVSKRIKLTGMKVIDRFLTKFAGSKSKSPSDFLIFFQSIIFQDFEAVVDEHEADEFANEQDAGLDNVFIFGYKDPLNFCAREIKTLILKEVNELKILNLNLPRIKESFVTFASCNIISSIFLDYLAKDLNILKEFVNLEKEKLPDDWRFLVALYNKLPFDETDPRQYLWTRDPISKPFDLNFFLSLEGDKLKLILEMKQFSSLNIYQIVIILQCIESKKFR